jgi:L-threonylcarbamoyladenylate synthase
MTVEEAADLIKKGGVVAFPTETVYGLGADVRNPAAVSKIFSLKGRPGDNPLIVHLSDKSQAADFVTAVPPEAEKLMEECWPGPLTIILKKKPEVLDAVTSGLPTVALRIPDHSLALALIRLTGPLVAPSANKSGKPSPTKPEHIERDFGDDFPILDGGVCRVGLESTVIDLTEKPYSLLRPGKYTREELSKIIGENIISEQQTSAKPRSPGLKYSHYQPDANVHWFDPKEKYDKNRTLLITHQDQPKGYPNHVYYNRDFDRMAHELYDQFRSADFKRLSTILIEPLPDPLSHPMIAALKNRIEKAVGQEP